MLFVPREGEPQDAEDLQERVVEALVLAVSQAASAGSRAKSAARARISFQESLVAAVGRVVRLAFRPQRSFPFHSSAARTGAASFRSIASA